MVGSRCFGCDRNRLVATASLGDETELSPDMVVASGSREPEFRAPVADSTRSSSEGELKYNSLRCRKRCELAWMD